jgi:predicted transglutaminase-like cysteine proteinase
MGLQSAVQHIKPEAPTLAPMAYTQFCLRYQEECRPRMMFRGGPAVTKRHELLDRGWPARALLLSEVVSRRGEHHLVLVVRTKSGDLVLDNMTAQIKPWSRAPYRWVRIQLPTDNRLWATISGRGI